MTGQRVRIWNMSIWNFAGEGISIGFDLVGFIYQKIPDE